MEESGQNNKTTNLLNMYQLFIVLKCMIIMVKHGFRNLNVEQYNYRFELGLEKPDPMRALHSAMTIAAAYIVGGLVPLAPYMFIPRASEALLFSVVVTLAALLIFGYAKGYFTGNKPFRSAFETALIGAIASAAAFGMAKVFNP